MLPSKSHAQIVPLPAKTNHSALVCFAGFAAEEGPGHKRLVHKARRHGVSLDVYKRQAVKVQGLDLEDAPAKRVNGHMFQPTGLTALRDVGAEAGKVTVWGDVFFTEIKGNWRKIYSISITDYTCLLYTSRCV